MVDPILPKAHFQRILTEIVNNYTQNLHWSPEFATSLQQQMETFLRVKSWQAFNLRLKVDDRLEDEMYPDAANPLSVLEALDLLTVPKTIKLEDFPLIEEYEEPVKRGAKVYRKFEPMSETIPIFKGGPVVMEEINSISESMLQRLTLAGMQGLKLSSENYETIRQLIRIYLVDFIRFATVSLSSRYEFYMTFDPRVYLIPKEVKSGTLVLKDFDYASTIMEEMYSQDRSETILETLYQEAVRDLDAEKQEQEALDAKWLQLEAATKRITILQHRSVIQRLTYNLERLMEDGPEVSKQEYLPSSVIALAGHVEELLEKDHQERLYRTAQIQGMITVEDLNAYLGLKDADE
jgi:hypothetical protein